MADVENSFGLGPVHIAARSHYSTGQAAATAKELVTRAKKIGARTLGLMDEDSMSGGLAFAMACRDAGIKPIMGIRVRLRLKALQATVPARVGLVALNDAGLVNLNRLTGIMHRRVPAYLTTDELVDHADGVAFLTGNSRDGILARIISGLDENAAAISLYWLSRKFEGRLFVEIERPGPVDMEEKLIRLAMGGFRIANTENATIVESAPEIPLIGTTDIRYTTPDKHGAWAIIDADRRNRKVSYERITAPDPGDLMHMRDAGEIDTLFADLPEATIHAGRLAIIANAAPSKAPVSLPSWPDLGPGETEDQLLRDMAEAGLAQRFEDHGVPEDRRQEYVERLNFELGVIGRMGFSGYFMMVADFVNYALDQDIPVGPGRGSGAGSLVAWAIGITRPDPIRYGLLFERFLNPDRVSMPDFDVDFCGTRRGEVMEYIRRRYGDYRVANIATFGEIKAKKGLKTVQRVLTNDGGQELHHAEANLLTKQMPSDKAVLTYVKEYNEGDKARTNGVPLKEDVTIENIAYASPLLWQDLADARKRVAALKERGIPAYSIKGNIFSMTRQVEGYYNVAGTHAAGLAIAAGDLTDRIPMLPDRSPGRQGHVVCGYDMKYAELAGLVKFDILGLKTATMIGQASRGIRKRVKGFDIEKIPVDDEQVLANFRNGLTSGVFQFESDGMRAALKQVAPTSLLDLAAAVALYRPGPMGNIPTFGARKRGDEEFTYFEPVEKTSQVLGETYGIIVYQEQVMQIAQVVAGFSLAAADLMRRAMGKKKADEMAALKAVFIDGDESKNIPGAVALGMSARDANALFDTIAKFADYGFNKSHALAYATIAYQTMWLKTHYPAEFLASAISIEMESSAKKGGRDLGRENIMMLRREAEHLGVKILMPDINKSAYECTAEDPKTVRLGLGIIKGISTLNDDFVAARDERPFESVEDFFERCIYVKIKGISSTGKETTRTGMFRVDQVTKLVGAGAFDSLNPQRSLVASECKARNDLKSAKSQKAKDAVVIPTEADPWLDEDRREFEATGMYLMHHPVERVADRLLRAGVVEMEHIETAVARGGPTGYPMIRIVALPQDIQDLISRTNSPYSRIRFGSRNMDWEAMLFTPRDRELREVYTTSRAMIEQAAKEHRAVVINCAVSFDGEGKNIRPRITIEQVIPTDTLLTEIERFDKRIAVVRGASEEQARRRAEAICRRMESHRADNHAAAVDFAVRWEGGGKSEMIDMPGGYLLDVRFQMEVRSDIDDLRILPNEPSATQRRDMRVKRAEAARRETMSGQGTVFAHRGKSFFGSSRPGLKPAPAAKAKIEQEFDVAPDAAPAP